MNWWPKRFRQSDAPVVSGSPGRVKTYSADSGYVYQYRFVGFRKEKGETFYAFSFTVARRPAATITVRIDPRALMPWQREHGREFTSSEGFGLAKMVLKKTFDDGSDPANLPVEIRPDAHLISQLAGVLDL